MTNRGFDAGEFDARTRAAQAHMAQVGLDALLLTTAPEVYYFTGFLTRFWESPSRPWFVVIPAAGKPIAVIPAIGQALMSSTWVDDIRTWPAPRPHDEGISLLADCLRDVTPESGAIGIPSGPETHLRLPLDAYRELAKLLGARRLMGDSAIVQSLRMVKSPAEIAKIETACAIAARAFAGVPEIAPAGTPLSTVFRRFQALLLGEGADWVPYLAGAGAAGGYSDVISPARDVPLNTGDILMLDTGAVWDGYFCDFNRNWAIGAASAAAQASHTRVIEATAAGFEAAKPGATAADVHRAMARLVGETDAGRMGHGLGLSLTEWPSILATDTTELVPGMVLTLEPAVTIGDKLMVHEENIVITQHGARKLTPFSGPNLPVIA